MGNCTSVADEEGHHETAAPGVPTGSNTPLVAAKTLEWTSPKPITMKELQGKRDVFWETQPSYSGKQEIWNALQGCCSSYLTGLALSQSIIDSVNIICPTGNLSDGCYDELGNNYVLPLYLFILPTNLIKDDSSSHLAEDAKGGPLGDAPSKPLTITFRLSTGKDLKLQVDAGQSFGQIKARILAEEGGLASLLAGGNASSSQNPGPIDPSKVKVRFLFLGRVMEEKLRLREVERLEDGGLVQVMLSVSDPGK